MTAIFTIFLNIKIANKVSLYEKHCKKRFQRKQTKSIPFCTKLCHLNSSPTKCVTTNRSQQTNKIHIQCTVSECTITFTINIYTTKNIWWISPFTRGYNDRCELILARVPLRHHTRLLGWIQINARIAPRVRGVAGRRAHPGAFIRDTGWAARPWSRIWREIDKAHAVSDSRVKWWWWKWVNFPRAQRKGRIMGCRISVCSFAICSSEESNFLSFTCVSDCWILNRNTPMEI